MSTITFDTLKYANTLKAGGVPDRQAEAEAVALSEVLEINLEELVTKRDLASALEIALSPIRADIAVLKSDAATAKWLLSFLVAGMVSLMVGMVTLVLKLVFV
jgi:hypothetical protein